MSKNNNSKRPNEADQQEAGNEKGQFGFLTVLHKWSISFTAACILAISAPASSYFMGRQDVVPPAVRDGFDTVTCHRQRFDGDGVYSVVTPLPNGRYATVETVVSENRFEILLQPGEVIAEGRNKPPCARWIKVEHLFLRAQQYGRVCLALDRLKGSETAKAEDIAEVFEFYNERVGLCIRSELRARSGDSNRVQG